jgi:hypothetical protein
LPLPFYCVNGIITLKVLCLPHIRKNKGAWPISPQLSSRLPSLSWAAVEGHFPICTHRSIQLLGPWLFNGKL